jgi:hypothetical protein
MTIAAAIAAMTVVMIDVTTTAATITVKTIIMTGVMIVINKTTTTAMTTVVRSLLLYRQKGATPMAHSRLPTDRSTSSLVVVGQPRVTDNNDQMQGRSAKST